MDSSINLGPSARVSCTTSGGGGVIGWLRQFGSSNDADLSAWTITDGPNGVITVELADAIATRAYPVPIGRSGSAAMFFSVIPLSNTVFQITVRDGTNAVVDLDNAQVNIGLVLYDT